MISLLLFGGCLITLAQLMERRLNVLQKAVKKTERRNS